MTQEGLQILSFSISWTKFGWSIESVESILWFCSDSCIRCAAPLGPNILPYICVPKVFIGFRQSPVQIEHCLTSDECLGSLTLWFCLFPVCEPFFSTCSESADAFIMTHTLLHHKLVFMTYVIIVYLSTPLLYDCQFVWIFWLFDWNCLVWCPVEVGSFRV